MGNCRLSGLYKQSIIVFLSTLHSLFYKIHHSISIHAPRGGSDVSCFTRQPPCSIFLSTLPVGGATGSRPEIIPSIPISIHAPRGGSDENPAYEDLIFSGFLSTLPVGGATAIANNLHLFGKTISIHAPRGGSDDCISRDCAQTESFLSTLPVGGATLSAGPLPGTGEISIHAPRGGSDYTACFRASRPSVFLSTLPVGGATANMIIFHSYLQQFIMQSDNFF